MGESQKPIRASTSQGKAKALGNEACKKTAQTDLSESFKLPCWLIKHRTPFPLQFWFFGVFFFVFSEEEVLSHQERCSLGSQTWKMPEAALARWSLALPSQTAIAPVCAEPVSANVINYHHLLSMCLLKCAHTNTNTLSSAKLAPCLLFWAIFK